MAQVRLYQDIDGCLNAEYNARMWRAHPEEVNAGYQRGFVSPEHDDYGERLTEYHTSPKYRMEWNERLVVELNTLDVELVWTTTWREDARKVGTLMGLLHQDQRVLHPKDGFTTFPSIEWKWEAIIEEQAASPSPFIAVDDEWISVEPFKRQALQSLGGLIICPDPNLGVTPRHIEEMRKYIANA